MASNLFTHVVERCRARMPAGGRVCAGFSGGLDSTVLLDILARSREATGITLSAVHIHHGLSPNADAWAEASEAFCRLRNVPLRVQRVQIDRESPRGLEAAAREARYAVYAALDVEAVTLAHHLDDQAETVLLQLLRSTGLKGASAMAEWRLLPGASAHVFRPLLPFPRAALLEHAKAQSLTWAEDESNAGSVFDRNFLRREVLPRIETRYPDWRDALARFARHAAGASELLAALAHEDGVPRAPGVPLGELRTEDPARRMNALRAFLEQNGLPMPSEARLAEMARQLFEAREDARVRIAHAGITLVRHRGEVSIDAGRDIPPWSVTWHGEPEVPLGEGLGCVRFVLGEGLGLDAARIADAGWRFAPRAGGERIRLEPGRPTRTLKNLLQEHGVPEWQRDRLPLLFHGQELVWVPGIGLAAAYRCPPGAPGLAPEWLSA